jgi:hypothetical protein
MRASDGFGYNSHPARVGSRSPMALGLPTTAACFAGLLAAHFAPSPNENNRYAKVLILPDAVRVSYTVYFGERPGALERARMDTNRDGQLSDAETRAFGAALLAELAPSLVVTVDGMPAKAALWRLTDVGLGTPVVAGGSFSVDVALEVPFGDAPHPEHTLRFDDQWLPPTPGEAETRLEPAPGVTVVTSKGPRMDLTGGAGPKPTAPLDFRRRGGGAASGPAVIDATFRVTDEARAAAQRARAEAQRDALAKARTSRWWRLGILGVVLGVLGLVALGARARAGYRKAKG